MEFVRARKVRPFCLTGNLCLGLIPSDDRSNEVTPCTASERSFQKWVVMRRPLPAMVSAKESMMPIHAWWERVVTTWKRFRPTRRRRSSARFFAETFEPRRMLSAFFVNSLADSHDSNPGDGNAADANGFATLRAALEEANAHLGADTISLPSGIIVLAAANGPLTVTDDVTILGHSASEIDGTSFDQAFLVRGTSHLEIDRVTVFSSGTFAASMRPMLLTTNARQADLVLAFSATPSMPFLADTKATIELPSLNGTTATDVFVDRSSRVPGSRIVTLDESAVPTPDQAIDQIINALFRSEPDFVLPIGAEESPRLLREGDSRPMSKSDSDESSPTPNTPPNVIPETQPESMSSDDESSSESRDENSVSAILRGWADEAGWGEFDFLTRGSPTVAALPRHGSRIAALAGSLLTGVVTSSWSRADLGSWRDSVSGIAWRIRVERLRRRAR